MGVRGGEAGVRTIGVAVIDGVALTSIDGSVDPATSALEACLDILAFSLSRSLSRACSAGRVSKTNFLQDLKAFFPCSKNG